MAAMSRSRRAAIPVLLAVVVTAYGGLLRLDALVQRHGAVDRPAWARVLTHEGASFAARVRPSGYRWAAATPYVGGDPINYLKYAREMRSFYQAHVREPIFLAVTRGFLWVLSDQDVAVSFASMAGSTLAIFATYLLGAAFLSRTAGLAAALALAVEFDAISWSVEGWRDDVFTSTVVLSAWAFVRCRREPTRAHAILLGLAAAAACLTRITALSFVLPGLCWLTFDGDEAARRPRAKASAVAAFVLTVLVSPYLVSCAIATGDPFYAIDYHTGFYRYGEGLPSDQPMSAAAYVAAKVSRRPIAGFDTAVTGLFVQPFAIKWKGLDAWVRGTGQVIACLAIAGLLGWLFFADGRMLWIVLFGSLLPYAFTWNVAGGREWRFTMHAYPFYLLAACFVAQVGWRGATTLWREGPRGASAGGRWLAGRVLTGATLAGLAYVTYAALPWFVVREAIADKDDVSVETGARDQAFFGAGWSDAYADGLNFRVSQGERSVVRIPLPERRTYQIVLRLDPVAPGRQHRAVVLLNRQLLAILHLTWNPDRVGSYPLQLPSDKIRAGSNELTIVPDTLVPGAEAVVRLPSHEPADRFGVRLWYVRVLAPNPSILNR